MRSISVCFFLFVSSSLIGQVCQLAAPPVLGHIDFKEANIWVSTTDPCTVDIIYWDVLLPETKLRARGAVDNKEYLCTIIPVVNLEPGTTYEYQIKVRGITAEEVYPKGNEHYFFTTETLWQYRTDPPNFKIAVGSCAFLNEPKYDRPGKGYGNSYTIFDTIASKHPELMIWLGDNVYFREVDFESKSSMIRRYYQARQLPELSKLWTTCAHYAIWDDHDFGPNDSNGSYVHKDWTLDIFKHFWPNPSFGGPATGDGITTHFAYNDVEFFMLDNRYHRGLSDAEGVEKTILGQEQLDWLIEALKTSKAKFKLVAMGGQFLNTEAKFENYSTFPEERDEIIRLIEVNNIKGVVFLTGDRHCTELSKLELKNGNVIYDLTASPLTSGAYNNSKENNTLRVDGTIVDTQNFALLNFSGPLKERVMQIEIYDSEGKLRWTHNISSN